MDSQNLAPISTLFFSYIHTVHHDVIISESTTKRKRCDKEGEYSGANPYVSFISESEDESHCKTSKGYNNVYVHQTTCIIILK